MIPPEMVEAQSSPPTAGPDAALGGLRVPRREERAARRGLRRRLYVLLAAALFGAVAFALGPRALWPAVEVRLARVSAVYPAQTFTLLNASGYVVPQRKAALGSKITSRLVWLGVGEGDRVEAGQVVARLENADLTAARNRAEASVAVARADVAQAEAELDEAAASFGRTRDLLARKFVSQSEFDVSEARFRAAQAALATRKAALVAAQAALTEAEVQLDYSAIRAPFDGVVLTKNADIGDIVTPLGASAEARAAVVTMADPSSYQVEADVAESSVTRVRVGQPCELQLDALPDVRLLGRVAMLVPTADRGKATVLVRVAFVEADPRVLAEMSARVAFLGREVSAAEREPATAVPAAAVVERDGRAVVYTLRSERVAVAPVRLGRTLGDLREVLEGVAPGEQVVLYPPADLADGARVRVGEGGDAGG
jgi:RND family efflux transporter MFP subunit